MTIKTGTDIVQIKRIQKLAKNPAFLKRILTPTEQEYVQKKAERTNVKKMQVFATIAGLFAAKEAVSKALQTGLLKGIGFADITVSHTKTGAPVILLSAKAKKLLNDSHSISISISHDGEYAIATCTILES